MTEKDSKKRKGFEDQEEKEKKGVKLDLHSVKHMMHHFILI